MQNPPQLLRGLQLPAAPAYFMLLLAGAMILSSYPCLQVRAQGNLMIMPRRVVFEGAKRLHVLNLANTGKDTARYVISFLHYRMREDGSFEQMDAADSSGNFADKYVRFFPRSVVLGPNEAQSVRIQLRRPSQIPPGEYRSHLYFRAVPDENPLGDKTGKADSSEVAVRLVPVFGISVPVIIRVGKSNTEVSITASSIEMADTDTRLLKMTLNRKGNMSVYGNITVAHISPKGKVTEVAAIRGLAVYTPNSARQMKIALDNTRGVDYSNGKLHIVYKTPADVIPADTLAETSFWLQDTAFQE